MTDIERIRVVMLGDAGVGKSSIVKRFLFKTYTDKYKATVEDLYNREYDLGGFALKVDILDTSGDMQFPAMRRLSIATAHAFMLVYALTSSQSFQCVKSCFDEIRQQRADFQDIPIIIAGNKSDLGSTHLEVNLHEVNNWVFCELPPLRVKVIECSAKEDHNITQLFQTMLSLSRFLPETIPNDTNIGLKRRSSTYVSTSSSKSKMRNLTSPTVREERENLVEIDSATSSASETKSKPRSRSLIRRTSRKTKQHINNATEDCHLQ